MVSQEARFLLHSNLTQWPLLTCGLRRTLRRCNFLWSRIPLRRQYFQVAWRPRKRNDGILQRDIRTFLYPFFIFKVIQELSPTWVFWRWWRVEGTLDFSSCKLRSFYVNHLPMKPWSSRVKKYVKLHLVVVQVIWTNLLIGFFRLGASGSAMINV